jgi:hypothetical protein
MPNMHSNLARSLALTLAFAGAACDDDSGTIRQVFPELRLEPATVDFGDVQIGTSVTKTVLIKNDGEANLSVDAIVEGTPFDDVFTYVVNEDNVLPVTVPPNGAAFLNLKFSPIEERAYAARLNVRSSDDKATATEVSIAGRGVSTTLAVTPDVLSFGNVVINTSKTLPIMLSNNSAVDARVEYVAGQNVRRCTSGAGDPSTFCILLRDREIGPDGTFSLGAGESTTMEVQFTPTIAGTRERGNFVLKGCPAPACEVTVQLDGLGIESGFQCMPASVDFGQVNPGSCLTRNVACTNIANEQITVVDWIIGAQSSPDFTAEAATVQVLDEGDSIDVDLTYCPDVLAEDTGELQIETDNPDVRLRTVVVPLEGTGGGPDIDVLPTTVNFGLVSLIAPSRRTVTIQNVGYSPLEVTDFVVDAAATGAFTAPGAAGDRLEPGEFLDITIEFQPVAEGPVTSTLLIHSNDQDEPEVTVTLLGEGVNLPPCSFQVNPVTLSFGVVERSRVAGRAFEIQNTGADDCLVTSARMQPGSDQEFSLPDGDVTSVIIPSGASFTIRVEYAPTALGDDSGAVEFSISSPTSPFNLVAVNGTGADATLLIVPRDLDFGVIGVGCNARARTVTIYNTGSTGARIDDISIPGTSSAFNLTNLPAPLNAMPLSLAPGASTTFDVGFHADAVSSYAGAVEITGEFGGQPVTYIVSLIGHGAIDATQVDEFEQLGKPKVDILFVIDFSGSMGEEQASLGSNFQAFVQFANAQGIDYQLGVTTTDTNDEAGRLMHSNGSTAFGGPVANKIVTPQTVPSPEQVFATNVQGRPLSGGSAADEAGFEAAYLALSNPVINGHNAGFLRQDAVLSIIFVSDEEEQSPNAADFYINFFLSIKGFRNTNLFSASAIVGDTPSGCSGPGGSASDGLRYVEAANRTGGVFQSICTSDWSRALEDLSTTAFGFKSRFFLTNQPVINTIEVYIDGMLLPATSPGGTVNWSYDYGTNAINFSPFAVPEPGAMIRVEYTVECL